MVLADSRARIIACILIVKVLYMGNYTGLQNVEGTGLLPTTDNPFLLFLRDTDTTPLAKHRSSDINISMKLHSVTLEDGGGEVAPRPIFALRRGLSKHAS